MITTARLWEMLKAHKVHVAGVEPSKWVKGYVVVRYPMWVEVNHGVSKLEIGMHCINLDADEHVIGEEISSIAGRIAPLPKEVAAQC